jgi:hypothetical protein
MFQQPNQEIEHSLRPEIKQVFTIPSNPEVVVPVEAFPIGRARSDVDSIYRSSPEGLRTPEQMMFDEIVHLSEVLDAALAYRLDSQFVRTPQDDLDLAA